jgi:hypothetical protein
MCARSTYLRARQPAALVREATAAQEASYADRTEKLISVFFLKTSGVRFSCLLIRKLRIAKHDILTCRTRSSQKCAVITALHEREIFLKQIKRSNFYFAEALQDSRCSGAASRGSAVVTRQWYRNGSIRRFHCILFVRNRSCITSFQHVPV